MLLYFLVSPEIIATAMPLQCNREWNTEKYIYLKTTGKCVPVIMMTADTSKDTLTEALPLDIKGYLIKPPTLDALKAKIKAAVN
jgi:CheY-like chemotaxis protein